MGKSSVQHTIVVLGPKVRVTFAFRLGWLIELISQYSDATSYNELRTHYQEIPKDSFDYEVVERDESVAVLSYAGTWKDIGTWNTLCE